MDCEVERPSGVARGAGMLNVPPGADGAPPQTLTTAPYAPSETDQAQFEADKRAVYKHPLFPLLALLFERCELATQSSDTQSSDAFNLDIQAFVQHQERDRKPFLANEPEIDGLMIKAIQVLRIHLLELEKVQELCKDFCNRYITCLKGKMQSENLLRSDYTQGPGVMSALENNNNMLSHGNSESGSDSNSPVQYTISPTQQSAVQPGPDCLEPRGVLTQDTAPDYPHHHAIPPLQQNAAQQHSAAAAAAAAQAAQQSSGQVTPTGSYSSVAAGTNSNSSTPGTGGGGGSIVGLQVSPSVLGGGGGVVAASNGNYDPHVVHGSTPLGQIGANVCPIPVDTSSIMSGQLSPAPTTPGGSADDCDSDFTGRIGSKKQKRGVLPKHATSVMRSWLFQHLVHPYPTEDEKRNIAAQTNLTLLQVNNWFINARRRILQPMLDAGAPPGSGGGGGDAPGTLGLVVGSKTQSGGAAAHRKKGHNNGQGNRRYWPGDIASLQPQLTSGDLSSSEDECDDYSSDENDGGLIIDANTVAAAAATVAVGGASGGDNQALIIGGGGGGGANGHHDTPISYSPDSDQP